MDDIVERLSERGLTRDEAARVIHATLESLGERLTEDEARALALALPPMHARSLLELDYDGDFDAAELFERVRRRTHREPGPNREQAQMVLRAVGERLDASLRRRLARALPSEIMDLFEERNDAEPPPHATHARLPRRPTLASGRPGSAHPLSEARVERAHSHSVVREENPHGETKLSSASGTTQERLGDSLAVGRPASAKPLSQSGGAR